MENILSKNNRSCGGCTECCEGWLVADINGHRMFPGRPCQYKGKEGCSIYENRPVNPCVNYKCEWLMDDGEEIPEWMKPNLSKVIITRRVWGKNKDKIFLDIKECGEKIDSVVLNWVYMYGAMKNIAMRIEVNGGPNYLGPPEFSEEMINRNNAPVV